MAMKSQDVNKNGRNNPPPSEKQHDDSQNKERLPPNYDG